MLIYAKIAAPTAPKRRSRAGCTYCKEKRKKCDETRPRCSRCAEHDQDCAYEPVKPRQRKKRESFVGQVHESEGPRERRPTLISDAELYDDSNTGNVAEYYKYYGEEAVIDDMSSLTSPLGTSWAHDSIPAIQSPLNIFSSPFDFSMDPSQHDDVDEEVIPMGHVPQMAVTRVQRHYPDLAMSSSAPLGSPHLEFVLPVFSEFSNCANRRALVDHFANVLSHLIVLRETEFGNPFQQLVLPLCYSSTTVQNAMYALSSAHLEHRGSGRNEEKSVYFHNQAIQGLARLIEMGDKADREELLAAIMLLVYFELLQRGRSSIVDGHLKGAMIIMSQNDQKPTSTSAFLERAFRFYDVIAALSFGRAPITTAPAAGCLNPVSPIDPLDVSSTNKVDTLLGLSTTLWPILHRLSNLRPLKKELEAALTAPHLNGPKVAVLRTEFETNADAIEGALENWRPSLSLGLTSGDLKVSEGAEALDTERPHETPNRAHLQSIIHNALAYRHSAFLYLYRTIHGHPRRHHLVQHHAHASLTHCMATVLHGGPLGTLLWPLFVAACEAVTLEDREFARQAFMAVDKRQGMANIERGWIIVQEVWRRSDFMDIEGHLADPPEIPRFPMMPTGATSGDDIWRSVSEDMGVTIVFG
ncbi:hypothetical protein FALCPG4_008644 [Fusarium falciforme]